jgi:hypothetical protein
MNMEIAAIQATTPVAPMERRGTLDIPAPLLLAALADGSVSEGSRKLAMETLSTWGSIAARVVEHRPDGKTVLEFASARLVLRLPETRTPGDTIMLTLADDRAESSPAPTRDGDISNAARLLARLSSPPGSAAPGLAALGYATSGAEAGATAPSAPLAASANVPDNLASALSRAISDSGLFYESHLARWTIDDYSLPDIRREPQSRATLDGTNDLGPGGLPGEQPPIVAEHLVPLLRQQLNALESQLIPWSGVLWPGQSGDIEIQRDAHQPGASTDTPSVWITRVTLDLPRLGRVETLLALHGDRVALSVSSALPRTAAELAAQTSSLELALAARGVRADSLVVRTAEVVQ